MPPRGRGPRLWLRPPRRAVSGEVTHDAVWLVIDGKHQESTRCGYHDRGGAEQALAQYIARKHLFGTATRPRSPEHIPVADVLALYANDVVPKHSRPRETAQRMARLLTFFGTMTLGQINGARCREYAAQRTTLTVARKELEDMRAAIHHHRREGLCSEIVEVVLPPAPQARERWLTRDEAARLIRAAWRYRETQKGKPTDRKTRRHVARFILVALYTGTRTGLICTAALKPAVGRGWIDLERGIFYRRPSGKPQTKKRAPPIPLPSALLAHISRWKRRGQNYLIEWNGRPVRDVDKAFRRTVEFAGLDRTVTPHSLRHTCATWLMQAGTDIWEAAGFLGMSVELMSRRYGHHHPNHLTGARDAFRRHRLVRKGKIDATETERPAALFTKV